MTVAILFLAVGSTAICGFCGGALYYFQPHISEDSADVQALMAELVTLDVPQVRDSDSIQFVARGTIEWNLAFMITLRGAYFETASAEQDGVLTFLEVHGSSMKKENVRSHVEGILRERDTGGAELTPIGKTETRALNIRGEPTPFTFEAGVDPVTHTEYRLVNGIVLGNRGGDVLISLRIKNAPPWDDSVAERMIESIQ
jgi:hypothetical protein